MSFCIVLLLDVITLRINIADIEVDMVYKERCVLVLIHRAFLNDEETQKMTGKHSSDHIDPVSSVHRSGNGSRVLRFIYTPAFICPMEPRT
ncbi:hypothetical protein TNCV_255891 [Trichonephila clavipes]|nr:hypothetical protein TNCV_255891 [Trichonephila clavipes]